MEDVVIVGAGIVGLATARALQERRPGVGVTVLEKADDVATAQTGHNSGVIHAGLYYAPGSLKARLCRAGEAATKRFCADHGIAFRTAGKLVVATNDVEVERLRALGERAASNGIRLRRDGTSVTLDSFVQGDLLDPEVEGLMQKRDLCLHTILILSIFKYKNFSYRCSKMPMRASCPGL